MKHIKKKIFTGKKKSHMKSIIINLSNSLIIHNSIITIFSRGKKVIRFLEPLLSKMCKNYFKSRRIIFNKLRNKNSVDILFKKLYYNIYNCKFGFIRIIKLGYRKGDMSKMCILTFVFNKKINY